MGCGQSKIENEEAVLRCKDRKLYMKDAVSARNAFAAAHSSYATNLKNTGAALSDFANGEVAHFHSSPSVHPTVSSSSAASTSAPTFDPFPPPPPLPNFSFPLQRAATMPEIKPDPQRPVTGTIIEEEGDESDGEDPRTRLKRRSGSSHRNSRVVEDEGGPPPVVSREEAAPMPPQHEHNTPYEYIFSMDNMPGTTFNDAIPVPEFVEISVSKGEMERKVSEEKSKRPVGDDRGVGGGGEEVKGTDQKIEAAMPAAGRFVKKVKVAKSNLNLLQIFLELDDDFLKASESAHEVSKLLEATKLHYHSNFADNRGHIDHSATVMRVITWNRSCKGLNGANADDWKDDFDSEEHETHATVLDKLLAWEKKLYDEVKTGELMKFEYQKKVGSLDKLKKRGTNSEALEKAKAAVSHLHTRYIVDMQSMDSTVLEISRLRDDQLFPKLFQLVEGMATMWEIIQSYHEDQSKKVMALRSLDISQSPKETSEHHHERTYQLWAVVQDWHSHFHKLVNYQKEYIKALNNWLKLNLIPVDSNLKEKVSVPPIENPPIHRLLRAWHDHLEKLPDEFARTAIHNFGAVISSILQHQDEELKLKQKCEDTSKELARKTRQYQDWHRKYMQRRAPDESDPEGAEDKTQNDILVEKQFMVDTVQKRLEEEKEAYQRHCLQVREKSLASLKTHLPELFRELSNFSRACSKMYRNLRSVSQPPNPSQRSL